MASQFVGRNDPHFDATTGVLATEYGEVPTQKFHIDPGTQERGSVVINGSEVEVGTTPGGHTPGKSSMTMYFAHFMQWRADMLNQIPEQRLRDHLFTWTATYTFVDEEGNPQPSRVVSFRGYVEVPSAFDTDRTQGNQPITIDIPIRNFGRVTGLDDA